MLGQIINTRALLRGNRPTAPITIDFAVPHSLSLTYIPKWLSGVEKSFGAVNTRLMALNVHDAVMTLVEGGCDLLLCYHHPRQPVQLDAGRYDMLQLGQETMRAYVHCDKSGKPDHILPGNEREPLPFLSYTSNAYLGRMVELILSDPKNPLHLLKRYETDMAESLKMMALEGHGVAFLPQSSVQREVRYRQLAAADGGRSEWSVDMEIRLYRERPTAQRSGKPVVDRLWSHLSQLQLASKGKTADKSDTVAKQPGRRGRSSKAV
jgi:DNA-binding transcriptional LysR family regulator